MQQASAGIRTSQGKAHSLEGEKYSETQLFKREKLRLSQNRENSQCRDQSDTGLCNVCCKSFHSPELHRPTAASPVAQTAGIQVTTRCNPSSQAVQRQAVNSPATIRAVSKLAPATATVLSYLETKPYSQQPRRWRDSVSQRRRSTTTELV